MEKYARLRRCGRVTFQHPWVTHKSFPTIALAQKVSLDGEQRVSDGRMAI
jgi:hypothetical protein